MAGSSFSFRRVAALCRKEAVQILRDPGSVLIAFVIPLVLMLVFGYGISFDSSTLRVGIALEDTGPQARRLAYAFSASTYIDAHISCRRADLVELMQAGKLRGLVVIPEDFSRKLARGERVSLQVITDGSEPNTANFVHGFTRGAVQTWQRNLAQDLGQKPRSIFNTNVSYWFNPSAVSRNFIMPGAITIIITVVGAILTALVIAREWERGTMEALLSTQVGKAEFLLSKLIPYYFLSMFALTVCLFFSTVIFQVPVRGSVLILFGLSTLFMANTLGLGLLISTSLRNQFNAAQIALVAAFLPAVMLSGFAFEIDSMPAAVRAITYLIPAKYYVNAMHTLFLAGNVPSILLTNAAFLLCTGAIFIGLTALRTKFKLE